MKANMRTTAASVTAGTADVARNKARDGQSVQHILLPGIRRRGLLTGNTKVLLFLKEVVHNCWAIEVVVVMATMP